MSNAQFIFDSISKASSLPVPSSIKTKDDVAPYFEHKAGDWLEKARTAAVRLCVKNGSVTAEDVRSVCPIPPGLHPNVMGAVLKCHLFIPIGFEEATRKSSKGRILRRYQLSSNTEAIHG